MPNETRYYNSDTPVPRAKAHEGTMPLWLDWRLFIGVCALAILSSSQSARAYEDIFLLDELNYYDPLSNNQDYNPVQENLRVSVMDDESLFLTAAFLKDNQINATQRALNYQWLQDYQMDKSSSHGRKVLQKLLLSGLKTYFQNKNNNGTTPTGEKVTKVIATGSGTIKDNLKYKVKASSSKIRFSIKYEF